MERTIGTVSRGVRAPIIREGDDIAAIVIDSVLKAVKSENITLHNRDVISVTEAIVARAQGNYASVENIGDDIYAKFGDNAFGVIFPILSRNRFAICLRGIARGAAKGAKKIVLMFSYPSDEVGNQLVSLDALDEKGINPWTDVMDLTAYRKNFGENLHPFTGVDYVAYYSDIIAEYGVETEVVFANDPREILKHTKYVLQCDIHSRERTKRILRKAGAEAVFGLDDVMTAPINGSGFNDSYGLLGSNKATEETVKLFPRNCMPVVERIQQGIKDATGVTVEVMVYGDGAFKDPVGGIWELADPVISPAYTSGLEGKPNELKLKYLADNQFADLSGDALKNAIEGYIKDKSSDLMGSMESQGTTPRRLTDLIGSLSDLTSGSGDKGTPIILIQGYFDNYAE